MRRRLNRVPGNYRATLRRSAGDAVTPLFVAERTAARARGLLGLRRFDAALLIRPCRSVHTFGMSMAIDVAFLDTSGLVVDVVSPLPPNRLTRPRLRARSVLETSAGRLAEWGLGLGDVLLIDRDSGGLEPEPTPLPTRPGD